MIQISGASEKLQIVTASATATLDVQVDFANWDTTAGTPKVDAPKNQCTAISGAATTDVLAAPGANVSSRVKAVFVTNTHASLPQTFNLQRILSGPTTFKFKTITLQPNEMAIMNEHGVWFVYDGIGAVKGTAQGPVDVQIFTSTGANTWTKPTSFTPKCTIVNIWGAGGGGGGGAFNRAEMATVDLGTTVTVTIGAGGTAGAASTAGAAGGDGGVGGTTTFGSLLSAFGGGGGRGGAISAAVSGGGGGGGTTSAGGTGSTTAGAPGGPAPHATAATGTQNSVGTEGGIGTVAVPTTNQNCAEYGGAGGGGAAATPVAAGLGASSLFGGGGGGHGGSHSATPTIIAGGAGGASASYTVGGGGAVGTDGAAPTVGANGADGDSTKGGAGGGGGGTTVTASTAGKAGGNGGRGGGGGGGGGVGQNPGVGGAGGTGGNGYAVVISF